MEIINIVVAGSPSYENFLNLKTQFKSYKKIIFKKLNIPTTKKIFTLFLSPPSFTNTQIKEIIEITKCIVNEINDYWIVIKTHPKTRESDAKKIKILLSKITQNFTFIKRFYGDLWNAKLVLCSYCLVQKQSTTGYLGFIFKIPIISYNIHITNYDDDLYKVLGGSMHSETKEEFIKNLKQLSNESFKKKMILKQEIACKNFCDINKFHLMKL